MSSSPHDASSPATLDRPWKPHWTLIGERRERLRELGRRFDRPQEFHILGAGVAALAAAIEILDLPLPGGRRHSVTIHEADERRIGGRINTKRLGPRPPAGEPDTRPTFERGAMRIPTSHDYTWAYAREAPAPLLRRRFSNDDQSHDMFGRVFRPADFAALARTLRVRDPEAERGPGYLFAKNVLEPELKALDEAYGGEDRWAPLLIEGRIEGAALRRIDGLRLDEVLQVRLAEDPGQVAFLSKLLFPGLLDRAFLMFVRSWLTNRGDLYELCRVHESGAVLAGMDLLVEAMRSRVDAGEGSIRLGRVVSAISATREGDWQVRFAGGETLAREGRPDRHLLCTLPFAVLRHLELDISPTKREVIEMLNYAKATKVAVHVSRRFWEDPEFRIRGGRSWNDRYVISSYYPNDHTPYEEIPERSDAPANYDLYTQPALTRSPEQVAALAAEPARPGPWLLLSSYTFGEEAHRVGRQGPLATVRDLLRVFPGIDPKVFREAESETWYWNDQPLAGGPFALPEPRDVSRLYRVAREPDRGIHFAGDHLSPEPGWIQGSLYSSLWSLERLLEGATSEGAATAP